MKTVVVIPNYNGVKFMDSCMSALKKQTYRDFCVLIVDNGSTDGSVELLRKYEAAGEAKVLYLPENTGFSGAVNAGISTALSFAEKPEYIVLLNNDTEAEPEYLSAMAKVMEEDAEDRIGAVSPLMLSLHNPSLIDSAGDGYALVGWAFQRGVGRNISLHKFSKQTEVFSACAGAAMYRTKALEEIRFIRKEERQISAAGSTDSKDDRQSSAFGSTDSKDNRQSSAAGSTDSKDDQQSSAVDCADNKDDQRTSADACAGMQDSGWFFDPAHFAYLEDVDVSFRMRIHGFRIVYEPASRVLHVGSGTSGSRYNPFKVRLAARNNVWLNYKNMPLLMLLVNLPFILAGVLVKQLFFLRRGFGKEYFNGFLEGLKGLPKIHAHKVPYRIARTCSYLKLEGKMLLDLFSYLQDLLSRHFFD